LGIGITNCLHKCTMDSRRRKAKVLRQQQCNQLHNNLVRLCDVRARLGRYHRFH